jgi:peptidoglycan/LPS O-acetylase OafA/YrhL
MTFADHLGRKGFKGPGFDRIRLIGALIVVWHHCSFYATANIADDFLSAASGGAIDFGRFAVNMFFITRGVLVTP